jgi:DNA-binding transcriptional regulator YiaG
MARRSKGKRTFRTIDEKIARLEARVAELKASERERGMFSPEAVRKDRKRLDLTAKEYAELVGVAMITIFSWENGRTRPRASQVQKWLAVRAMSKDAAWKKLGLEELPPFDGKQVLAERRRLGLSAANYGRLVGVTMLTIYKWESGQAVPRTATMEQWLAVKGIGKAKALEKLGLG